MASHTDSAGRPVVFGSELGRGGEATVYEVVGKSDLVAKLFAAPGADKAAKLVAMLADASPPASVCAWPMATVHNGRGAVPVGYLMPKVQGCALDSLLVPVQRHRDFPGVDWRFIVHAARNLADGVAEVHRRGYIIGDLNENNVRVTRTGEVKFIDCDSFQVRSGNRMLRCEVATLLYWPPELQGMNADAIDRTANHDAFALAVLLFRLLFLGRHPFAGRFTGRGEQPDIPELIRTHRFAFGARSPQLQVQPPPNALRLQQLPSGLGTLFERAFAPDSAVQNGRPTPGEWVGSLEALAKDLVRCSATTAHWYPKSAGGCPWCEIERAAGTALFFDPVAGATGSSSEAMGGQVDVDVLWRAIAAVPAPPPAAQLVPEPPTLKHLGALIAPTPGAARLKALAKLMWAFSVFYALISLNAGAPDRGMVIGGAVALLAFALHAIAAVRLSMRAKQFGPVVEALNDLRKAWQLAQQEVESSGRDFGRIRDQLAANLAEHKKLRPAYDKELERLRAGAQKAQLHAHLQSYSVRGLRLPNIGPAVVRALEAYGIYTAGDIVYDRVRYVKGIGPKRADALVNWRRSCESQFRFDPNRGVDRGALAALRQRFVTQHESLVGALASGPRVLTNTRERTEQIARARREALQGLAARAESLLASPK